MESILISKDEHICANKCISDSQFTELQFIAYKKTTVSMVCRLKK